MKKNLFRLIAVCVLGTLLVPLAAAQNPPARPFHDGSVWELTFVRMKPGLGLNYMNYLADQWKKEQEALKKAGMITDYKVLATEAHGTTDWDVMLMTQYKDLATMEANQDKAEAVVYQALQMTDQKMQAGYQERSSWREIMGQRIAREIVMEPKMAAAR